jgi:hypothetical protein
MKHLFRITILLTIITLLFSSCSDNKCITCFGTGEANCTYCYGQGKQTCNECSGSGKNNRYDYGYNSSKGGQYDYHYDLFPCKKCSQTGKIECSNYSCVEGKIKCTSCNATGEEESGFFSGIKDGFLIIYSLLGKLFGFTISIYASNTSGLFYWVGFVFGIMIFVSIVGSNKN